MLGACMLTYYIRKKPMQESLLARHDMRGEPLPSMLMTNGPSQESVPDFFVDSSHRRSKSEAKQVVHHIGGVGGVKVEECLNALSPTFWKITIKHKLMKVTSKPFVGKYPCYKIKII